VRKAREEGREEGKIDVALKMIAKGKPFEEISEITELSIKQIEQLAQNNKVSESSAKYKAQRKTTKTRKK
jgi:predicted transposase YdaD